MNRRTCTLIACLFLVILVTACGNGDSSSATPIPGWEKFEGRGIELWLPESFDGGDPTSEDLEMIIEGLRSLGPDFDQMAQMVEQNRSVFVIWAFDSELGDSGILTNAIVGTERVPTALKMDTYLDAVTKQLPAQFRVDKREIVKLGEYEAGRLVIDFTMSGAHAKQLMYTIKDSGTMWSVNYTTGAEEMDQRLPTFEQSIRTFKIQSPD